jgi:DNA-damage-inducible protein D
LNNGLKLSISEKELSGLIFQKGIDNAGFARIRSKGDMALFGGKTTLDMKARLGIPDNRLLADNYHKSQRLCKRVDQCKYS